MARALDEMEGETVDDDGSAAGEGAAGGGPAQSMALVDALTGIKLRVWAELGRTQLGLSRALGLPLGSVVELDHPADAPVDLYVNGLRFAQGHLIVTDDGEWAFQCDTVGGRAVPDPPSRETPAADLFAAPLEGSDIIEVPEIVLAPEAVEAVDEAPEAVEAVDEAAEADEPVDEAPEVVEAADEAPETVETAGEPDDVIVAETPADTPAAPRTPNQEGAVD